MSDVRGMSGEIVRGMRGMRGVSLATRLLKPTPLATLAPLMPSPLIFSPPYFVVLWSSVTQMVPTMSSAEQPRERSFIAFARPWRFGPIASASPRRCAIL